MQGTGQGVDEGSGHADDTVLQAASTPTRYVCELVTVLKLLLCL